MKLYFIGTIREIDIEGVHGTRTVGYYEDLDTAIECVENNWCDIHENGYYKYAVIEDVEQGLYKSTDSSPMFFKWEDGKYSRIDFPAELKDFVGFTIG